MKKNNIKKICIVGNGWSAKSALIGISSLNCDIIVVSEDNTVISLAKKFGFNFSKSIFNIKADLFICSGFKMILKKSFLQQNLVINIHYSILPKYRGLHSVIWAVLNNEPFFGLSIHLMNEFIDDGPIIYQNKFRNKGQNSRQIVEKCNTHIEKNLSKIIKKFLKNKIKPKPQKKSLATWVCKRNLDDCIINFNQSILEIDLFFKALVEPYPLPRIKINDRLIEVTDYQLLKAKYYTTIGTVINIENKSIWIKVNDGILILRKARDPLTKNDVNLKDYFKLSMRLK